MTNKEQYCLWAETQHNLPLSMQPWWMDAVCAGKEWDVLLYHNPRTEKILAVMPYLIRRRWWGDYILMPQMTPAGGIWLDQSLMNDDGTVWDRTTQVDIIDRFVQQLDGMHLSYYCQHFPVGSPCVDLLREKGMTIKEKQTFRVDDLSDMKKVEEQFSNNKRRQLQKAANLHVERGMNVEDFYRFHTQCMQARGRKVSYTREFLLVLHRKAERNQCCDILRICDEQGETCAAAFVVWDKQYLYYLIPCYNAEKKDTGAGALLVLEAMRLAREKKVRFDFEGSSHSGIANHYRQFGSTPHPYYSVEKLYRPFFLLALLVNRLRNLRYGF